MLPGFYIGGAPKAYQGVSPLLSRLRGLGSVVHRTLLVERTVLLYWMLYKAQKATCSYEMKMMHEVTIQTIHCVSKTHEKNVSQISGMAWSAIRHNNYSNSHHSGNTLHRFRLTASCINSYDDLLNLFCHQGEVGSISAVIPTVLNHSLNVWAQLTYSISSKIINNLY